MVPQPQIYIARHNFKNLAAPMSILNIAVPAASRIKITRHGRVSYGSSRSASIFINAGGPTRGTLVTSLLYRFRRRTPLKGKQNGRNLPRKIVRPLLPRTGLILCCPKSRRDVIQKLTPPRRVGWGAQALRAP
jgi:hypothetical protein